MNKKSFQELLQEPSALSQENISGLEEVVKNFPYCQVAHSLLAKGYREQGNMLSEKKLSKAAVYSSSRKKLRELILKEAPKPQTPVQQEQPARPSEDALSKLRKLGLEARNKAKEAQQASQEIPSSFDFELPTGTKGTEEIIEEIAKKETTPNPRVQGKKFNIDLIDNFIKSNPAINRQSLREGIESFQEGDLAWKSGQESNKFISENLAKIHIRQGNIEKAISIYRELMLKYPDKKGYFVEQIQRLTK